MLSNSKRILAHCPAYIIFPCVNFTYSVFSIHWSSSLDPITNFECPISRIPITFFAHNRHTIFGWQKISLLKTTTNKLKFRILKVGNSVLDPVNFFRNLLTKNSKINQKNLQFLMEIS